MGVFVCLPDLFSSSRFRPPDYSFSAVVFLALGLLLCARTLAAQVVINELYYDHPGGDTGYEFVELINISDNPVAAVDISLDFHNGSDTGWETIWTGETGLIAPGGLYLVGGVFVSPLPDAVSGFSIQNGPDAIRVCLSGMETDRIGYGGLEDPDYCELAGTPALTAGLSVSRVPDGTDTNHNAADFSETSPSPGSWNLARRDAGIGPGGSTRSAGVLDIDGYESVEFELYNHGIYDFSPGEIAVEIFDSTESSRLVVETVVFTETIEPGTGFVFGITVQLSPGYHWVLARLRLAADERTGNNTTTLVRRVGGPALILSEVLCYPADGCPQFVELYNAGVAPVDINGFLLRDKSHGYTVVTSQACSIPPGGFIAVTPDAGELVRCFPSMPAGTALQHEGTWPALNRTGSAGLADSVVLADRLSLIVAAVDYPPVGADHKGRSLERIDMYTSGLYAAWVLSNDPSGASPGRSHNRALFDPPPAGTVGVSPRTFSPYAGETVTVAVSSTEGVRVVAGIHDTLGHRLAELGTSTVSPAVFVWGGMGAGGDPVPPGLYIVVCEFFSESGVRLDSQKVVVGCGRDRL